MNLFKTTSKIAFATWVALASAMVSSASAVGDQSPDSCLQRFFFAVNEAVPCTSPAVVERALGSMGLSDQPLARAHLGDLLTGPQLLSSQCNGALVCLLGQSQAAKQMSCEAEESMAGGSWNFTENWRQWSHLGDTVHSAIAWDKLTKALLDDTMLLTQVAEIMTTRQCREAENYARKFVSNKENRDACLVNCRSAALGSRHLGQALSENSKLHLAREQLQLNILQGVKIDVRNGHETNARVGLALASLAQSQPPVVETHELSWRLGKEWIDSHLAWNGAFVAGSLPLKSMAELMIPVVSCSASSSSCGESFAASRMVSAALATMQLHQPLLSGIGVTEESARAAQQHCEADVSDVSLQDRRPFVSCWGEANSKSWALATPCGDNVEKMLFALCAGRCRMGSFRVSDTTPMSSLDEENFHVCVGFVLMVTVLLAGLGLELLVWLIFLQSNWSRQQEERWRLAQFVFPLLAATTLGLALCQNYLALPFLVLGLFKFGFPEILTYTYAATFDTTNSRLGRIVDFVNGVGTLTHHGAASLLICMLLTRVAPPSRCVVDPILILLMQHWFALMRHFNKWLHLILELALEVWFEWVVTSNFEAIASLHWTAWLAAATMLVAHWLYLLGASLALLTTEGQIASKEEKVRMSLRCVLGDDVGASGVVSSRSELPHLPAVIKEDELDDSTEINSRSWSTDNDVEEVMAGPTP